MTPTSFILFNVKRQCYGEKPYAIVFVGEYPTSVVILTLFRKARMKDTNINFRMEDVVSILTEINKKGRGIVIEPNYFKKHGEILGRPFFTDLLRPYFDTKMAKCFAPDEECARGNHYLTLTDELGLADFSRLYEKALNQAEKNAGTNRSIERVETILNIFAPATPSKLCTATLLIRYVRSESTESPSYVTEQCQEINYEIYLHHSDSMVDNPQMPDIEERSIASPVYLVNSQNVKNTFGHTVKENPLAIYLCARRYGWSEVRFFGQQVLLKADIHIR
ncbi:hypothetical protein BIZ78_gp096 [Erwinia phage vB_EamM_Caitlin]|uniref:hypothetical protein n=1 Tax=Erwinia phage vB_EamM_Caitlin TaxID=1883379 RepID=UPI00081C54DC|nr:hypothetical protein BIZ78_gp096 [Erwinia phage vB_EamM_Caitlin]ANZ48479.1 hypothetical protein CAITLIN_184 [Erwinia phage vB_EamM_Caitlin]